MLKDYSIGRKIGDGGNAIVHIVKRIRDEKILALKAISLTKYNEDEVLSLEKLSKYPDCHPNIICYYESFKDAKRAYIVAELYGGKTLDYYCRKENKLDEKRCRNIMNQCLSTLKFIHDNNIVHRDIKPENIIVGKDDVIKFIDFGNSCSEEVCSPSFKGMTFDFVAPEVWRIDYDDNGKKQEEKNEKNIKIAIKAMFKSDIYSLGCTFFEMVNSRTLHEEKDSSEEMIKYILDSNITSSSGYELLDKIINIMIIKDYDERASLEKCLRMIE